MLGIASFSRFIVRYSIGNAIKSAVSAGDCPHVQRQRCSEAKYSKSGRSSLDHPGTEELSVSSLHLRNYNPLGRERLFRMIFFLQNCVKLDLHSSFFRLLRFLF